MCEDTGMFNMDVSEVGSAIVEVALWKRERKQDVFVLVSTTQGISC